MELGEKLEWWPCKEREVPVIGQGSECDISCAPRNEFWVPGQLARPAPRDTFPQVAARCALAPGLADAGRGQAGLSLPQDTQPERKSPLSRSCCCHSRACACQVTCEEPAEGARPVLRGAAQWPGELLQTKSRQCLSLANRRVICSPAPFPSVPSPQPMGGGLCV